MFMIYIHTRFNLPSCSGSLFVAGKVKAIGNFHMAAMLLFTLYKQMASTEGAYFFEDILPDITSRSYIK
jgi:hypothetical protein